MNGKKTDSRLDGVVVSVLATIPKSRGFEPGQGNGFLRTIKSAAHFPSDVSADRTTRQYWWLPERSGRKVRS
jgi:hypothetical protein